MFLDDQMIDLRVKKQEIKLKQINFLVAFSACTPTVIQFSSIFIYMNLVVSDFIDVGSSTFIATKFIMIRH